MWKRLKNIWAWGAYQPTHFVSPGTQTPHAKAVRDPEIVSHGKAVVIDDPVDILS